MFTAPCVYILYIYIYTDRFRVNVTAPDVQLVGSPLTLHCTIVELVNGSNGSNTLEIAWTDNSGTLRKTNITSSGMEGLLPVYTDSFMIARLTTSDHNREIQCIANRTDPPVTESDTIILNVTGKTCIFQIIFYHKM